MARRRRQDEGSVSGFVVVITLLLVICAGLVIDGARVVGAKVSAADQAENAARAGAQELVALRSGAWALDPVRATNTANAYLAAHGVSGMVSVSPHRITVTVRSTVSTTLLALVGVSSKSVSATRSSDPVSQ
jgi:Putative Flp pilus-assembly TadE/G-like